MDCCECTYRRSFISFTLRQHCWSSAAKLLDASQSCACFFQEDGLSVIDKCTVSIYLTQVFTVQRADLWWPRCQSLIVTNKVINSGAGTKSRAAETTSKVQLIASLSSKVHVSFLCGSFIFFQFLIYDVTGSIGKVQCVCRCCIGNIWLACLVEKNGLEVEEE